MSFLNVLVFCLSAESGERVSYAITVLLAIAVFMTIINDTLPKKSEPLPLISYFLMIDLIVSALTSLFTILNLRIYHKSDEKPVPRWLSSMYRFLAYSFRLDRNKAENLVKRYNGNDDTETMTAKDRSKFKKRNSVFEIDFISRHAYKHSPVQTYNPSVSSTQNETNIKWKEISEMFDYMLLTFFTLVTLVCFLTFIIITQFQ